MVSGKNILIGITGGIAAYKTAHLVREFIKAGANVKCIQTPASKSFITPLTLSTLSHNEVFSEFTTDEENPRWNDHVSLGLWADLFIIAPATANTLAKMCQGICDNLLMATYLSAKCPVYFAPAMDLDMYKHPSTKENFLQLKSFGNTLIPAEHGELASGLVGEGRMAEPEHIYQFVCKDLADQLPLKNTKALVTAGPTYESIDPVRFIGNRSSGKMGCELALNLAKQGADVQLILGPSAQNPTHENLSISRVESAEEMFQACMEYFETSDIVVAAAAVADYSPASKHANKLKKGDGLPQIELQQTKDILAHMGANKKHQFLVGFALETTNEIEHAQSKLKNKNLDLIVLNSLNDKGAGFEFDTNKITLFTKDNKKLSFELKSKQEVAKDIVNTILSQIDA
ncbi:MAG: bifunctional phosphopantothenoylcysteine decarboxylase/phosphopantothenate--cysteine ligase CoaBC [Flavobacteriales bacterium]|nr:bifunctional phosphopantothenoylcysteine decarboxylase/phosphopantothenate--cysteine ligase CoaBC [Flavobacteriales bacterium]